MKEGNSLGLLEKFAKVQKEILNSPPVLDYNDHLYAVSNKDEIMDKITYYKQMINFKEDESFHYDQSQKDFFDFFEHQFAQIYDFKDMTQYKLHTEEVENFINENKHILLTKSTGVSKTANSKKIMSELLNYITFLEDNLNFNTERENMSIDRLKEFSQMIKDYAADYDYEKNDISMIENINEIPIQNHNKNINFSISKFADRTSKESLKRRSDLLSTAYIKKSKSQFGIDDELFSPVSDNEDKITKLAPKDKKLILRNFLQIYLVKENNIFSQSYFSKYDHSVLYSYRKYKFYEIKLCFSIDDSFTEIKSHIEFLKSLFSKFVIIYKQDKGRNFIKTIICGIGKKQSVIKNSLIKCVNNDVKKDCLIKISFFSNVFDCLKSNLEKIRRKSKGIYYHHTNFSDEILKKIVKKLKKK